MRMVGEDYFYEDAVNMTYSDAYEKALEESGLEPVDRADVELKDHIAFALKWAILLATLQLLFVVVTGIIPF